MTKQSKNRRKNSRSKRSGCSQRGERLTANESNALTKHPLIDFHGDMKPEGFAPEALTFHCQLAHGSPTGIVSGFSSLPQLYQAIASCYDGVSADDILFCTTNTHKVCMDSLLCAGLQSNDFIFAHTAGQAKEVILTKTENALGLTISDNGAGKAFVKRVKPNSMCFKSHPAVQVGDHIEKINNETMKGKRHFDVAHVLRQIPVGQTFTLRLVEPLKSAFDFNNRNTKKPLNSQIDCGLKTLRFRADGKAVIQEKPPCPITKEINEIFDSYLGFHDDELAEVAWEIGLKCSQITEMEARFKEVSTESILFTMVLLNKHYWSLDKISGLTFLHYLLPRPFQSEIAKFDFPIELLFDIWGVVDDWKKKRSKVPSRECVQQCGAIETD
ncbi:unnamed protein product [Toxocara canis]|uniref:PDZ domain-containing protein n=1 Tax=Toxocara canis TaxID=6265 RepID=A0A183UQR3_TOXCA|nr:unnamed protein product [Toxocara canis]